MSQLVKESKPHKLRVVRPSDEKRKPPFYVTREEELALRIAADRIDPALVITRATSFDEYVRQLMIPTTVMEMSRKADDLRFASWEVESIRASLADGILKKILREKKKLDNSHPPYIRVACTGKGDYDDLAQEHLSARYGLFMTAEEQEHEGDYGSPVILEIWPAKHYSPIHSHGDTTGIIYCLTGQIDVMVYEKLAWDSKQAGLLTLTPGQCAWLTKDRFAVHKVYCPMAEGNFAATFHVYLNEDELPLVRMTAPKPHTRDIFMYIDEKPPHKKKKFTTYSDLSWRILRKEMAQYAAQNGM
ncbi:MAG TPA: hypothetical protein VE842_12015 [Pyrinomonadaceae bacterium]|jgi:hypothetical protein|nr:hypothetical protein [Pyrinomonadaceae bacterium]